jgi:hypothetical protein
MARNREINYWAQIRSDEDFEKLLSSKALLGKISRILGVRLTFYVSKTLTSSPRCLPKFFRALHNEHSWAIGESKGMILLSKKTL